MGLLASWNCAHPPTFDLGGRSVVDIGGGPVSLLLKCVNFGRVLVVDPAPYPPWVKARYKAHGVALKSEEGEDFVASKNGTTGRQAFDDAWIYNVLTHAKDPGRIIARAKAAAATIRIFEWLNMPAREGHPQELHREQLEEWLGAPGFVAHLNEDGAVGDCFYGVFASNR
jgi:hypothetical protein